MKQKGDGFRSFQLVEQTYWPLWCLNKASLLQFVFVVSLGRYSDFTVTIIMKQNLCNYTLLKYTNLKKELKIVMIMINLCQDGISIFGKSDGIDYCGFHYHGITIMLILLFIISRYSILSRHYYSCIESIRKAP